MDFLSGPEESRGGAAGPLPVRPLALQEGFEELWMMSEDDVEARPPAMLVQGNFSLPLGEVTTLFGDGGTGKSLVAQDLSIAVAMGQPFLGSQVKSGIVLYLDFEQHKNVALRRFGRLLRGRNLAPSDLKDRLFYRNFSTSGVSMKDLGTLIRQMLADYAPSLVIVDGRQLAYGGDQVDGAVVTEVNKHLKWLTNNGTATVLELDHPSSGSKRAHEVGGNRFKRQHSRAQWELTADAKDRDKLTLTLRKENDGLSRTPITFWRVGEPSDASLRHELTCASKAGVVSFDLGELSQQSLYQRAVLDVLREALPSSLTSGELCKRVAAVLSLSPGSVRNNLSKEMGPLFKQKLVRVVPEGRSKHYKATGKW